MKNEKRDLMRRAEELRKKRQLKQWANRVAKHQDYKKLIEDLS